MAKFTELIDELLSYGLKNNLFDEEDLYLCLNKLLMTLKEDSYDGIFDSFDGNIKENIRPIHEILTDMCDIAVKEGIIETDSVTFRDIFDTCLMGDILSSPALINNKFKALYEKSPKEATDYFYKLSCDNNYIRRDRIAKDRRWTVDTEYGVLDITINLSKPEKDPKAIAMAKKNTAFVYPKCQLCIENEGYMGRADHPARRNHRVMRIDINGEKWGFQYSPYVYYNEHCIVFNTKHVPMKIDKSAFVKLFDFVRQFPHYFVGSNADLPIVGGSILAHEHFQGGHFEFAMERAGIKKEISFKGYDNVKAGIVKWPMSVIRLTSPDVEALTELSDKILTTWREYTDEAAFIYAYTDDEPHNTITPIVRRRGEDFEIDLVLRNNITTEQNPLGVYHPHAEFHHIKKENIGLIEVMGLAVLPARLKNEMEEVKKCLINGSDMRANEATCSHADWGEEILKKYPEINESNADEIIEKEVGLVFNEVLKCAGVYKDTKEGENAMLRFVDFVNQK
ncbi:MAG: UDP-glucose--hexose-1-phosphate uridylyltransferase [Lachnospiraceae bacterium]|nr:UDP-glucose--hexose-1-phosphate uridylyltransferase [Lachnospiraceae bacterium]